MLLIFFLSPVGKIPAGSGMQVMVSHHYLTPQNFSLQSTIWFQLNNQTQEFRIRERSIYSNKILILLSFHSPQKFKKKKINFLPHFSKSPLIRHDSSPKYKAGDKRRWESTAPLIFQEIELTARIEMDNKYLLRLQPGVLSNTKKWANLATKGIFYKNVQHAEALSGVTTANCWREVASLTTC